MAFTAPIDEKQLIKSLQDKKSARNAFELLTRTYGEQLYWQIRKLVINHDDANDILQQSLLKVWQNIHNFRGEAKLSTWLNKIAINESINFLNKERKRREILNGEDDSYLTDNLTSDPYFNGDELQLQLQKAISQLPEKQRLVFNMRYFDDMKYEDISEILGTSVGALKANYHHAVKKISEYFDGMEF